MQNPQDPKDNTIYCDLCCLQPDGSLRWPTCYQPQLAVVDGPTSGSTGHFAYMCVRHLASVGYFNSQMNTPVNKQQG